MKKLIIGFMLVTISISLLANTIVTQYCESCTTPMDYATAGLKYIGFTKSYGNDVLNERHSTVVYNKWGTKSTTVVIVPMAIPTMKLFSAFQWSIGTGGLSFNIGVNGLDDLIDILIYVGSENPPIRMSKKEAHAILSDPLNSGTIPRATIPNYGPNTWTAGANAWGTSGYAAPPMYGPRAYGSSYMAMTYSFNPFGNFFNAGYYGN